MICDMPRDQFALHKVRYNGRAGSLHKVGMLHTCRYVDRYLR